MKMRIFYWFYRFVTVAPTGLCVRPKRSLSFSFNNLNVQHEYLEENFILVSTYDVIVKIICHSSLVKVFLLLFSVD